MSKIRKKKAPIQKTIPTETCDHDWETVRSNTTRSAVVALGYKLYGIFNYATVGDEILITISKLGSMWLPIVNWTDNVCLKCGMCDSSGKADALSKVTKGMAKYKIKKEREELAQKLWEEGCEQQKEGI
jgi:hypothetical protein